MTGKVSSIIVTTGRGPMTDYSLLNLRHMWGPLYSLEILVNIAVLLSWAIKRKIKRKNSVFVVHGALNLAPLIAARLLGLPVVWHFHETTLRFVRLVAFGRWILKGSTHVLAVVANKTTEVYGLDSPAFLPASVDTLFWTRDAVTHVDLSANDWGVLAGGEAQPMRLLVVGNLNPLKGIDILLCALEKIAVPWHLKVIGAELQTHTEYALRLYKHAAEISKNNVASRVEFLGWRNRENVRSLLATCDLFVLPSRSEACPIALLEAMAMGCRCLAADVGDVRLMLKDYPLCTIIPVGSVEECINGLMKATKHELSPGKGRRDVGATWKLAELAKRTESIYLNLLNLINR